MRQGSPKCVDIVTRSLLVFGLAAILAPTPAPADEPSKAPNDAVPETSYGGEFCEVLHRFNADKKISYPEVRTRVTGEFGAADDVDRRRTWNVETACGEFLVAAPLWADVSPPVLEHKGGYLFEDSMGASWEFQAGPDGAAVGVTMVAADGVVSSMTRLGDTRHWGDPHESLNGKHIKDWEGRKR